MGHRGNEAPAAIPAEGIYIRAMVLLCIVYLMFSAAYNYLTPAKTQQVLQARDGGAANADELAHMLYVRAVASGHIPVFTAKNGDYEAHQPPLYYIIAAPLYALSPSDPVYMAQIPNVPAIWSKQVSNVRWAAAVLGLALIWTTFLIVRDLLPDRSDVALGTALLVALIPMNVSLSSAVSNDTAANLVFALYLLFSGRYLLRPESPVKGGLILAAVLAAGVWTKSSTLLLLPLSVISIGYAVWRKVVPSKSALIYLTIAFVGALVLSLPWLLRNQRLYGDLFAQTVIFHDLAARNIAPSTLIDALGVSWYIQHFIGWTFASYWGVFDSMNLFLPGNIYLVLGLVAVVSIVGGSVKLARLPKSPAAATILLTWAVLTVVTAGAYVQYNIHFFQLQGRYLYPSLIPFSATSLYFLRDILPTKYVQWGSIALVLSLILLNLLCLTMLSGRYSA